jgi:hypothetical protein
LVTESRFANPSAPHGGQSGIRYRDHDRNRRRHLSRLTSDRQSSTAGLLEVQCRHRNHTELIDLTLAIWPRGNQVHTLKSALYCRPFMKERGKKRRPDIVGIRERSELDPEASAMAQRKD